MGMSQDARIEYHLRELEIARNPASPDHVMPVITERDRAILDLGCGIGQTLLVAGGRDDGRLLVGLDPDQQALAYGRERFEHLNFVNGAAESLPFQSGLFDLVISRVALPYTDLPLALSEIARVLKPGGRVWLTLHSWSLATRFLSEAVRNFQPKRAALSGYVIANGVCFHLFGRVFRCPVDGRYESFQTEGGMTRALKQAGFGNISARNERHFLITAEKTT
jgi:SAM-dependent methyltransferase